MDHQVVKGGGGGKQVQQQSGYGGVGMKRSESEMVLEELIRMMMIAGSTPDAAPNHHPTPSTTTITSSSPPSTLQNQINTHGHHQMLLDIYDDHLLSFLSADNESSSSIFDNDQYPNHYNDCIHPRPQFHQVTTTTTTTKQLIPKRLHIIYMMSGRKRMRVYYWQQMVNPEQLRCCIQTKLYHRAIILKYLLRVRTNY